MGLLEYLKIDLVEFGLCYGGFTRLKTRLLGVNR